MFWKSLLKPINELVLLGNFNSLPFGLLLPECATLMAGPQQRSREHQCVEKAELIFTSDADLVDT